MVRPVRLHFLAASRTTELVITGIGVADTDFRLKVPVSSENPRITVSNAGAHEPALITGIFQLPGISAEHVDLSVKTADIVLSAMYMSAKKMRTETIT